MVARLTPDQKVACSNHVGVTKFFSLSFVTFGTSSYFLLATVYQFYPVKNISAFEFSFLLLFLLLFLLMLLLLLFLLLFCLHSYSLHQKKVTGHLQAQRSQQGTVSAAEIFLT